MKNLKQVTITMALVMIGALATAQAQEESKTKQTAMEPQILNTYLIERDIEGAGEFTDEDLKNISKISCTVLTEMDQNEIQWVQSYVAEDKVYCVYRAKNKELIKEHAKKGNFPWNSISLVSGEMEPATAK